jgi:hypothetical protein
MALWGNNDSKTASGYANISSNGFVNGTSSSFQTEARVGDFIVMANNDYMIMSITSSTAAQVVGMFQNTSVTAQANAAYVLSEKPRSAIMDDGSKNGNQGIQNSNTIYGMDTTEGQVANGAVREVVITNPGSGYNSNAAIAWTGGVGNTVAVADAANNTSNGAIITLGRVTSVRTANVGAGFTIGPVATVSAPALIIFNGNTAVSATNDTITITSANSRFSVGDPVTYAGNSASTPAGLVDSTKYFVSFANTTVLALAATAGGANLDIAKASGDTTSAAGATLQGDTATVVAVLSGVHHSAHAGWVRRTVGTGGRAGRVTHETLVAMGSIAGDASDDSVLPDA